MAVDYTDQVDAVIKMLAGNKFPKDSPVFEKAMGWVSAFPHGVGEVKRKQLINTITDTFTITEQEIYQHITGVKMDLIGEQEEADDEAELEAMIPKGSYLDWYVQYTKGTESPMSFHVFAGLSTLGAALGRRVYKDKGGFFKIYPNYCVILIGPTGKVMKTSAVDIASGLIKEAVLCPVMADAITPEALVNALVKSGHHFVYAPEFAVFFGRQKYNEGLTTLMLRLLDCPSTYTRTTMGGGDITITDVAITLLGGSTLSLLAGSTPDQVTSSGFLNRFVLVVENDTNRCFSEPKRGDPALRMKMLLTLDRLKAFAGEVTFDDEATAWFDNWYRERKKLLRTLDNEMTAEVIQRGPVHLERTAMLIHLSHCDNFVVCVNCLRAAANLMGFIERRVPQMVTALGNSVSAKDSEYVLAALKRLNGVSDRSTLMRRCSSRMDKTVFDRHIATLKETKLIREEKRGLAVVYILEAANG